MRSEFLLFINFLRNILHKEMFYRIKNRGKIKKKIGSSFLIRQTRIFLSVVVVGVPLKHWL